MRRWLSCLSQRLSQDRSGAVAILFALALLPMLGLVGAAIDYASASSAKSEASNIADSAAIAAVSDANVKPTTPWAEQREISQKAAKSEFFGQIAARNSTWKIVNANIRAEQVGSSIRVTMCYEAEIRTKILQVAGIASLPFASCAQAQSAPPVYSSVYALVDASGSMGIGSTHADQALMERRLGCAFACHTINDVNDRACNTAGGNIPRNWWSQTPKCAAIIGAKTRFDVVRNALIKVTDQAKTLSRVSQQYQLSVHTFSNHLTEVQKSTSSMSIARTAIERMNMDQRGAGTNFYRVLPEFTRLLPASGDGRTPQSPRVFVLLLTDGIGSRVFEENRCFFGGSAPCQFEGRWRQDPDYVLESPFVDGSIRSQAFPARLCDEMKRRNITVLTLATEFDSSGINDAHMKNVDRTLRSLAMNNLANCASGPSNAYRANQAADIDRAISQMFSSVVEKARLVR
ncbi:MAG: TadE/TadG family type IV pilus assembly protein [Rhabdaerophilum sp.]